MLNMTKIEDKQLTIENLVTIEELENGVGVLEIILNGSTKKINSYIGNRLVEAIKRLEHEILLDMWRYYITIQQKGLVTRITYTIM